MNHIDLVEKEMKASGEEIFSTGVVDQSKIEEFEILLGISFPDSYVDFLKKYGALSFCGDTYYGITNKGKDENQAPCVLYVTQDGRARGDISDKMLIIKSSGYGPSYSIDTEMIGESGEPVVVETQLSYKDTEEKIIIADSYGEFILKQIKEAIEDI